MELTNKRLLSLDILRGATIIFMIIVNDPGSWDHVYAPLLHAEWNGITPTDYIFPNFLFIVGVSIVLSVGKQIDNGKSKSEILKKIILRSIKIYLVISQQNSRNRIYFATKICLYIVTTIPSFQGYLKTDFKRRFLRSSLRKY